jgi:hypothetical protein
MLDLEQSREELRLRQRGLEFGHAVDVPRLAVVGHGLAAVPSGAPANAHVWRVQGAERSFAGGSRRSEARTGQVATETN